MKNKNIKHKGISLIISLGTSFIVLGVVMVILLAVSRSLEQSANLERANQVFFATESGVEAAFFHHNSRGSGANFVTDGSSENPGQRIRHTVVGALSNWKIEGRSASFSSLLKEDQNVQIPFFWDAAVIPTEPPTETSLSFGSESFTLAFSNDGFPVGFDFGDIEDEVLIDWKMSRKTAEGVQTFLPEDTGGCEGGTAFICESDLPATITSGDSINGRQQPCTQADNCPTTLVQFLSEGSNFKLSFKPLLSFESDDGTQKIPGIPFTLTTGGTEVPRDEYKIVADISLGDFTQKMELTIPEKTSIGSFDYVIFD